ncbi:antiterminator Q family protein [Moraxella sp. ZY210820]|uniref:antiterminator Q family protein n=1 Tax=Moraxella sp. ZY210820 TaxID=2904123 RepID=UPI002730D85C|nr:antiterminator Q family protein [Moraxella sp. ZY210820]WLF84818.1 hypothetical protein LU301_04975 [Moraxella sp. ZY210820]
MNWSKYSLDEWLEQFGAWCESCRMQTGHYPDNLQVNLIDKLMVETGYKKLPTHKNTVELKISDDEALQVQDLILSVYRRADNDMKQSLKYLFNHFVHGYSLRKIADICEISKHETERKIYGAKCFITGVYNFIRI